jgi:hypothetical protein
MDLFDGMKPEHEIQTNPVMNVICQPSWFELNDRPNSEISSQHELRARSDTRQVIR